MPCDAAVTLKARLQYDVKSALRSGDKARLSILRMALAAIQQRELDGRVTLDDTGVQAVLEKIVKQCQEALEQYQKGQRQDLAAKEAAEIEVLRAYLPEPLDAAATAALIDHVIRDTGAQSAKDMGRVMGELKRRAASRVDMRAVSGLVRARLTGV